MKTLKNITLFLFFSLLLSGCVKNYDAPLKTEKGKAIYNSWHKGVDTVLSRYIDIAFAFNAWHEAANHQKDSMEDKYLTSYKIRDLGNDQWGLYFGAELAYRIFRNNSSLSASNAVWIIEAKNATIDMLSGNNQDNYYSYERYEFASFLKDETTTIYISSIGNNEWDIDILDMNISIKSMDSIVPVSLFENSFAWSGEGSFTYSTYDSYAYIDFKTTEDIVFRHKNRQTNKPEENNLTYPKKTFYWSSGKVSLSATRSNSSDEVKTDASFSQLASSRFGIYITYKGITEEWIEFD